MLSLLNHFFFKSNPKGFPALKGEVSFYKISFSAVTRRFNLPKLHFKEKSVEDWKKTRQRDIKFSLHIVFGVQIN